MTYQLGVTLGDRLAAIAPQFGSFAQGFAAAPKSAVPVLDLHGSNDDTVPANYSLAGNGYYYTPVEEIFHGGKYSGGWMKANGCDGKPGLWPTKYDGQKQFWCIKLCSSGNVVRCAWKGGHNWLFGDAASNGGLVTDFLLRWTKTSWKGAAHPRLLTDVRVLDGAAADAAVAQPLPGWAADGAAPTLTAGTHYGDPASGCLDDEDAIVAGGGRVCAPKIGVKAAAADGLPTPECELGGVVPSDNGCPTDAALDAMADKKSKAWPVCLAKDSAKAPGGYANGAFHCLLVCPCGGGHGAKCDHASHKHCPGKSRCARGELRKMDLGVCTYDAVEA